MLQQNLVGMPTRHRRTTSNRLSLVGPELPMKKFTTNMQSWMIPTLQDTRTQLLTDDICPFGISFFFVKSKQILNLEQN